MKEALRAIGHVAFLAAMFAVLAFFFLGMLDLLPEHKLNSERPRGTASGGSP